MKVYIVTHGDYSDKTISAVFSTKEKALQFIADVEAKGCVDYNHTEFDEFEIDKATIEWFESGILSPKYTHREITKLY